MAELIDHTRTCRRYVPSPQSREIVERYAKEFDACHTELPNAALNLFAFHVDVPESHRVINYIDVRHDHGAFDYRKLVEHFIWASSTFNRNARLFFVTDKLGWAPSPRNNLEIVRLATNAKAPMLERVRAMSAYVKSRAFSSDTVFLDTDAFANRALNSVFDRNFDIGVTYRTTAGYMPLNEGVIFCGRSKRAAVRGFFDTYLATYEGLIGDSAIRSFYGDIERWRGGQLSLNAVACPVGDIAKIKTFHADGVRIGLFPCETFNYWIRGSQRRAWDEKFVLHLKGDSKRLIDDVIEYQGKRLGTLSQSAKSSSARGRRRDECGEAVRVPGSHRSI